MVESVERSTSSPVRVVIIEDDFTTALLMEKLLTLWGYEVVTAKDAVHGLGKIRDFQPAAVLCDICLPGGIDGYEIARAVRQDAAYGRPHLIAMTAYEGAYPRRRSQEVGYNHHLTKPVSPAVLKQLLAAVRTSGDGERSPSPD